MHDFVMKINSKITKNVIIR